jgi:electron transfer flavoprotein beta subunit
MTAWSRRHLMKIAVLVKYVPEPSSTWRYAADTTLDRSAVDGRLSELDEYAVEQAVSLVEGGLPATVTYLTMGPAKATDALRKALAMGGDEAVHVTDEALHGSDALGTSLALARALEQIGADLVVCGMASTDAEMSVVPAMVAERLGIPQLTFAGRLSVVDGTVTVSRDSETATEEVVAPLPALVSVTDQTGEARYPSFKAIMAGKRKKITTWSLGDLGVDPATVGLAGAATAVRDVAPLPPRQAGEVVTDEGDAAVRIADFLVARKLL